MKKRLLKYWRAHSGLRLEHIYIMRSMRGRCLQVAQPSLGGKVLAYRLGRFAQEVLAGQWVLESNRGLTNTEYEVLSLGQLYRDRADAENAFDELKRAKGATC